MYYRSTWVWLSTAALLLTVTSAVAAGTPTYSKDIAPILFQRCAGCHHAGDVAPMPLLTYQETRPWARAIREAVRLRKMPPWQADPHYGKFENDKRLPDEEIAAITAWVDSGAKEGDARDLPKKPEFPEGWKIGKPEVVIPIPTEYKVAANAPDQYVYFRVPTHFKTDMWVRGLELRAGNRKVVHHAHLYLVKDTAAKQTDEHFWFTEGGVRHVNPAMPVQNDGCALPEGGGWPGHPADESGGELGSFLPGKDPDLFPAGLARKIPASATLEFQVHYHATGNNEFDRTSVGLLFAKEPPRQALRWLEVTNLLFEIPPGAASEKVTACYTLPKDVLMVAYTAHMHLRGKDILFEAIRPNGTRETLLSVPGYDFNWQNQYRLKDPALLEKGTRLVVTAHFDNSARNPNNPDPAKPIRWGEPSFEEMMAGWFEYILPPTGGQARGGAPNSVSPAKGRQGSN